MRKNIFFLFTIAFFACKHHDKKTTIPGKESSGNIKDPVVNIPPEEKRIDSNLLFTTSTTILTLIKNKNYDSLATYFHPTEGVRFAPYTFTDSSARILHGEEFKALAKSNKKISWGLGWLDEEDPDSILTVKQYFNRYVYDVDFLKAPHSFNQYTNAGTDIDNSQDFYPGANTVHYFFDGFEKKYDGLDFRGLKLVYRLYQGKPYLVGIIHNEWTP
ncbi:MAG: hypothetical protein HOP10_05595 [Chitinophagaceae bacterium]|nr:hypothetical protein [Chitinophagaceae bacterium]